jgi:hypothetical protein
LLQTHLNIGRWHVRTSFAPCCREANRLLLAAREPHVGCMRTAASEQLLAPIRWLIPNPPPHSVRGLNPTHVYVPAQLLVLFLGFSFFSSASRSFPQLVHISTRTTRHEIGAASRPHQPVPPPSSARMNHILVYANELIVYANELLVYAHGLLLFAYDFQRTHDSQRTCAGLPLCLGRWCGRQVVVWVDADTFKGVVKPLVWPRLAVQDVS